MNYSFFSLSLIRHRPSSPLSREIWTMMVGSTWLEIATDSRGLSRVSKSIFMSLKYFFGLSASPSDRKIENTLFFLFVFLNRFKVLINFSIALKKLVPPILASISISIFSYWGLWYSIGGRASVPNLIIRRESTLGIAQI